MLKFHEPEAHGWFEALGYAVSYLLYRHLRNTKGDALGSDTRWSILAAAAVGALFGSRILGLLQEAPRVGLHAYELLMPGGKTVVGGLIGAWLAVEIVKPLLRISTRTGDLFALPLCIGIAIGRIGCLLAGINDDTYGKPTSLPWGIDFGDGVPRHPTQLYEIIFCLALAALLVLAGKRPHADGALFRLFLASYLGWRLLIDFLKPQPAIYGLSPIQWSCAVALVILAVQAVSDRSRTQRNNLAAENTP